MIEGLQERSNLLEVLEFEPESLEAALQRQAWRDAVIQPEEVASIAPEDDHTRAAQLGDQLVDVVEQGWDTMNTGKLLMMASLDLTSESETTYENITQVYIIQHGVLRNCRDYYCNMLRALTGTLKKDIEEMEATLASRGILVVAPQFAAEADLEGCEEEEVLCWPYNDWRSGEPASVGCAPISSYAAMDAVINLVRKKCPQLKLINGAGNSEGGQFWDRYGAFGNALEQFEKEVEGGTVEVTAFNMGTTLSFNTYRPYAPPEGRFLWETKYSSEEEKDTMSPLPLNVSDWGWYEVEEDSIANTWPFGMHNPPPYIQAILQGPLKRPAEKSTNPLTQAIKNYLRRVTVAVGRDDSSPVASQLPTGEGPDQQGADRVARAWYKWLHMHILASHYKEGPNARLLTVRGTGHAALPMMLGARAMLDLEYE